MTFLSKIKKSIMLLLVMTLAVSFLSGCSGEIKITAPLGSDTLLEINGTKCGMGVAMLRLLEVKEYYDTMEDDILWKRQIGDVTMAEYVKDSVKDEMMKYTASELMADDLTVYLTNDEITKASSDGAALIKKLGSIYDLEKYGISNSDATDLYKKRAMYEKVYNKVSENVTMEISESDTKVIEVNYVEIPSSVKESVVEDLRAQLKESTDFSGICEKSGYTAEMRRAIKRGDMPAAFESVAYALKDSELSDIVKTKDAYYIIYCVEDYMVAESVANSNEIISSARRKKFEEAYTEFASKSKVRFNNEEWNKIDISELD